MQHPFVVAGTTDGDAAPGSASTRRTRRLRTLLKNATSRCTRPRAGRNTFQFYTAEMNQATLERC
jgi:hypothetical protein